MTAIATSAETPQTRGQPRHPPSVAIAASLWSCLIVSDKDRLRKVMKSAASAAGWETVEHCTAAEAIRPAVLHNFPLSLIDLGKASPDGLYDDLVRVLRQSAGNLIVMCDHDANPAGELWSRQHGAWMYLPGVNEQSDLVRICEEAKAIVEKLRGEPASATHCP